MKPCRLPPSASRHAASSPASVAMRDRSEENRAVRFDPSE